MDWYLYLCHTVQKKSHFACLVFFSPTESKHLKTMDCIFDFSQVFHSIGHNNFC